MNISQMECVRVQGMTTAENNQMKYLVRFVTKTWDEIPQWLVQEIRASYQIGEVKIIVVFVNSDADRIREHNPTRALAFRGQVHFQLESDPESFGFVTLTLQHPAAWDKFGLEGIAAEIRTDISAILAWLESKPPRTSEK